jgi:hypothetical protein
MLQGLQQYSLVAGKTTALRMFADDAALTTIDLAQATVLRPGGSRIRISWSQNDYVTIPNSGAGASIVVRIPGSTLRWTGNYTVVARLLNANGEEIASYLLKNVELLPTKDLRVMVSRVWSGTPTKPGEIDAAHAAMHRLAALYPLRDGVSTLDGDYSAGLRYNLDDNTPGPPNQDNIAPLWDQYRNRPPNVDSIDVAITYRFPNEGEGPGASTKPAYEDKSNSYLHWSLIVWEPPFAMAFCQETGHGFGLEPVQDPHRDPGGQGMHSKDVTIAHDDAEFGFDPQLNEGFPDPTYDLMYAQGPSPGYPDGWICLNSWDWEYLRTQLAKLPSTGPTGDPVRLDTLAQLEAAGAIAGYYARDDQDQHVIVGAKDGTLTEVYWKPAQGVHEDVLTQFGNEIVGVGGYYAEDDDTQHAIVATSDGTLTEVYWKPGQGVNQDVLSQFGNGIVAIAGYYARDDQDQHVIVGAKDGTLTEVYWKPAQGVHEDVLTQFGNEIVGVGGYYAEDDDTQHAIVATSEGNLTEVYWKAS